MKTYYVYILTNKDGTVIYIGVTNNLERRMYEHKNKLTSGFSARYNLHKLVYVEQANDPASAIAYEKKLKGWSRAKKIALITASNPKWRDLSEDL